MQYSFSNLKVLLYVPIEILPASFLLGFRMGVAFVVYGVTLVFRGDEVFSFRVYVDDFLFWSVFSVGSLSYTKFETEIIVFGTFFLFGSFERLLGNLLWKNFSLIIECVTLFIWLN